MEVLAWLRVNAPERGRSRLIWDMLHDAIHGRTHAPLQRAETLDIPEGDLDSMLDGL